MPNRRQALASLLALAALPALPQGRVWKLGILIPNKRPASLAGHYYGAFIDGLRDLGYVEGKNLVIEWRYADDVYSRLPALAGELVKLNVDVVVTGGTIATRAAQKAVARTVPIVMLGVGDPVGSGLVESLARPGRNSTGISIVSSDLGPKWLEIARSVVPKLAKVGVLLNISNPAYTATLEGVWNSARVANLVVFPAEIRNGAEIDRAFDLFRRESVGAIIIQNEGLFADQSRHIAELAVKAKLPTITGRHEMAEAGCALSYGPNLEKQYRRGATHVDKILKGAKAGDLPVEQPTDYELFVNLKTARAIGLTVPKEILLRADKVIE